jgi:hypothetical protein
VFGILAGPVAAVPGKTLFEAVAGVAEKGYKAWC